MAANTTSRGATPTTKKRKRAGKKEGNKKKKDAKIKKQNNKKNKKKKEKAVPVPVELPLPHDVCLEIAKHVHESEALAFALSCKGFKDAMKEALRSRENTVYTGKRRKMLLTTRTKHYGWQPHYGLLKNTREVVPVTEDWIKWAFSMKWRYAARRKYNEKNKGKLLTSFAALGGFKDVLVWLRSEGCVFAWDICADAAYRGHIDVLEYLKSEGMVFDSRTCEGAAAGGRIEVLKYLKSEGVAFNWKTCVNAAGEGHIDVLKYLKSEGTSFDSWTCELAASGGHIDVLKYLKSEEVNCPWDIQNCLWKAKICGHKEVVTWIESFL